MLNHGLGAPHTPPPGDGFLDSQGDTEFFTATDSFDLSANALDSNRLLYLDLSTGNINYATPERTRSSSASLRYSMGNSHGFLPSAHLADIVGGDVDSPVFSASSRMGSNIPGPDLSNSQIFPPPENTQKPPPVSKLIKKFRGYVIKDAQLNDLTKDQRSHDNAQDTKATASGARHRITTAASRRRKAPILEMRSNISSSGEKDHPVTRKKSFKYSACARLERPNNISAAIAQHGFDHSTIDSLPPALRQYFFKRKPLPCPQIRYSTVLLEKAKSPASTSRLIQQQTLNSLVYQKYRQAVFSSGTHILPTFSQLFPNDRFLLSKRERHRMAKSLALELLIRRTVAAKVAYRIRNAYSD